jgi:Cdc6-like AAA superfamily ATPase
VLVPTTDGRPADTALITGPTGTVKTYIAQFTVGRLAAERCRDVPR